MELTELKSKLTLATVLHYYGLKGDKNNRIHCPFHADKTPSMQLYYKTHTCYCFSSNCKTHGKSLDVIDFIMHKENTTKAEAIQKAMQLLGENKTMNHETPPTPIVKPTMSKEQILHNMFTYFKNAVHNSKPAQEYIKQRGLDATKIEVGYNTAQFHHGARKEQTLINNCVAIGLLSPWGTSKTGEQAYKPFAKYCICFALRDVNHHITGMYFRSTVNDDTQKHYYLKDRQGLYPQYPSAATEKLILTESVIDAASLMQLESLTLGSSKLAVLACYGTNGLTAEHITAMKALKNLSEIIFAFDNDEAGGKAALKYATQLQETLPHLIYTTIELPCKDVNETLLAHNEEIFLHLLENRTFLFSTEQSIEKEKIQASESEASLTPIKNNNSEQTPIKSAVKEEVKPNTEPSQLSNFPTLNCSNPQQVTYHTAELLITLLGGISLQNLDRMRVTIYIRRNPHINARQSIRQQLDLYQDELVEKFIRKAAEKLEHGTTLISTAIAEMTQDIEAWRLAEIERKKITMKTKKQLTAAEQKEAIEKLQQENLLQFTQDTLLKTGIVGEATNAMILHIAMTSRLYNDPVSVICLSQSGTGKSYLLEKVAACFPPEEIIENTQFTDNSFYYWKEGVKGKIILIEDMEGAQNVEYPMRELITKKYITKTVVHKDSKGNLQTVQHRVEGPATFLGCTTKEKIYEDNANRCILIYLNNSKEQDKEVMDYQKQLRAGAIDKATEQQNRYCLQNMQAMLLAKKVINPYAPLIGLPESVLKPRRSIGILLSFIEAITLYHQYQCTVKEDCLITHPNHIQWAFNLLKESLFRKSDELSAALRSFLENIKAWLIQENKQSFYTQEIRQPFKLHPRSLRRYVYELQEYGYIRIAGGNKYKKGYEYELTPLATANNLYHTIDKHLQEVMEKIQQAYQAEQQQTAMAVGQVGQQ